VSAIIAHKRRITMIRLALACLFASVLALGCEQSPTPTSPPAKKDGVQIRAPGTKVDVEKGEGVKVRAPGVEVDVKK
jgi:hypothetical protein